MTGFLWTDARVEQLKLLQADGYSAGAIAAEMGATSRNAVLGKLHRLGIKGAGPRAVRVKRPPVARKAPFRPKPALAAPAPKPAPPATAEPPSAHRCDLAGLTNRSCRWPVTDLPPHMFCGAPEADLHDGRPYCPFHTRRAHDRSRDQEAA